MTLMKIAKKSLSVINCDTVKLKERIAKWSLARAICQNKYVDLITRLRKIVPDISDQYTNMKCFNSYIEMKMRAQQAFQCSMMLEAIQMKPANKQLIADIGDSAGTHMRYLKELVDDGLDVETLSVNLDSDAIEKIKGKGLNAICCRAENLDVKGMNVDMYVMFQIVEHLHNPAIYFRHLAKRGNCDLAVVTVPYMKQSRVGCYSVRTGNVWNVNAEGEHIFELSPKDWTILMRHAGWKVIKSEVYYQYPRRWPVVSSFLKMFWRSSDFEGFWGAILQKETSISDLYQDWED